MEIMFVSVFTVILELLVKESLGLIADGRCRRENGIFANPINCVSNITCLHTEVGLNISWTGPMDNAPTLDYLVYVTNVTINGYSQIALLNSTNVLMVNVAATTPRIDMNEEYGVTVLRRYSIIDLSRSYSTGRVCSKVRAPTEAARNNTTPGQLTTHEIKNDERTNEILCKGDLSKVEQNTKSADDQVLYGVIAGLCVIVLILTLITIAAIYRLRYVKKDLQMSKSRTTTNNDPTNNLNLVSQRVQHEGDADYTGLSQRNREDNDHTYTGLG